MAKNSVAEYDSTPANNTDVGGISITGGSIPSKFDDSQRQIMAHLRDEHDAVYALLGINRLINGGFDVNQRAVSGTVVLAAGDYGHDMWKAGSSGCTYTFATVNNVTTITISAGSLQQVVYGKNLVSGTYCLGWSGTAQGKIDSGSYADTGLTGTATGGTNLTVEFGTGTLSNVSLIEGSIAGNYKRRDIGVETLLCEQYYETGIRVVMNGYGLAGNTFNVSEPFKISKVGSPSIIAATIISLTNLALGTATTSTDYVNYVGTVSVSGAYVLILDNVTVEVSSY